MKKTIMILIQIVLWIIALIPVVYMTKKCSYAYFNGTYHGFNPDGKIYGIAAVVDVLLTYIVFLFPVFLLWFLWLVGTIIFTIKRINSK